MTPKEVRDELKQIEKGYQKLQTLDRYRIGATHVIERMRAFVKKWEAREKAMGRPRR